MAFVAYSAADEDLKSLISEALARANSRSRRVRFEPWLFNDVGGRPLNSPIVANIADSLFIVADITYLNLNVVYEIGLAIGTGKRAFLIRHEHTDGDKQLAQEAGIFDTLGYKEYADTDDLTHILSNYIDPTPLPLGAPMDRQAPVYAIQPLAKDPAATALTSRLKKTRYRYRSFNPTEDVRLSATDAIRQVDTSAGIALLLRHPTDSDGPVHNIRTLFVAGLAHGLQRPTLILSPIDVSPPLDVRDDARRYRDIEDIGKHIHEFALDITDYLQQADPSPIDETTVLRSLRMGDPTAENEMATLGHYYLRLNEYERTLRGEVSLVVGRKGSGKTALFIQVRDQIKRVRANVVLDLRPEGYQLIKLKEDIFQYLGDGARQHLITAFWEYLLLLEVAHKLLHKDQHTYRHNHEIREQYVGLRTLYQSGEFASEGDFSERLLELSTHLSESFRERFGTEAGQRLTADEVSELVYAHDIRTLRQNITEYLKSKRAVWILFDNLDKGWNTQGIDEIDGTVFRCLIDAGRKIEREMKRAGREVHCVVFVRNDVYENLLRSSADYGKEMRAVLDWTDPDMLREMLRLRMVSGLGESLEHTEFDALWRRICVSHFQGEETSSYMIDRCLMRPRNLLKLFGHSLGYANSFKRVVIAEEDIEKGLLAYSHDLVIELDRELADLFPSARDLLYQFLDAPRVMGLKEIRKRLSRSRIAESDWDRILEFLLYYGVIGLHLADGDLYIYEVNYDPNILRTRVQNAGAAALFSLNPAFWPALRTQSGSTPASDPI